MVKVLIGCAGWSYQDWSGVFYPKPLKAGQFLSYYAKFFDYTEVNSTFYNLPSEATIRKWAKDVPEDFRFTIKMWQNITHKKAGWEAAVDMFLARMESLESKIQGFLLQFPPRFK